MISFTILSSAFVFCYAILSMLIVLAPRIGLADHPGGRKQYGKQTPLIGTRHDEKLHEALLSREEMARAQDLGSYFRVPSDGRDLNYAKFVEQGSVGLTQSSHTEEYNSHNTTRLDVAGMKALLLKLDFMQRIARGEHATAED